MYVNVYVMQVSTIYQLHKFEPPALAGRNLPERGTKSKFRDLAGKALPPGKGGARVEGGLGYSIPLHPPSNTGISQNPINNIWGTGHGHSHG